MFLLPPALKLKQVSVALFLLALSVSVLQGQQNSNGSPHFLIIVVDSETAAHQALDRVNRGADFSVLAKEISIDPSAANGGDLGNVEVTALRAELRQAIQGKAPGQVSDIVKVPLGYAIVKVVSAPGPTPVSAMSPSGMLPLSAVSGLRYPPDVSGAVEFEVAFRKIPRPANWDQDLKTICTLRKKVPSLAIDHMEKLLDPKNPEGAHWGDPDEEVHTRYVLAEFYAYQGRMDKAIEEWRGAHELAETLVPGMVPELQEVLGTVFLHKAGLENNVFNDPGDKCIFPPRPDSTYSTKVSSEQSIAYFLKYLEKKPDDLEVKWLLNLAYMTIGKYPDGVPAKFLISPSVFESKQSIGRFQDVAAESGIRLTSMAGGLIVDDFENNGQLDIVTSSSDACEPLHYFHNNGNGTFSDRTQAAGLSDQLGGLSLFQTDYNNDGCLDIFVPRGAWQFPSHASLLRNNCDGTFTDVTKESGLGPAFAASQAAAWVDIDNDGWLDVFVGNEQGASLLFHNKGDGTFEEISHAAGVDRNAMTKAVVAADYDNDGYVDFYVSNLNGQNFLYHNNHDRTFTEVAKQAGVQHPWASFAAWFFDYDNDGWPDLFVPAYPMSLEEGLKSYLGLPHNAETLRLFKNLGNGIFREVTAEVGLDRVFNVMGSNFGDVDNDGYLDIRLGTGTPPYGNLLPNMLFRNNQGKSFVDITASSGTGDLHKGHGVAFADVERNGNENMLTMMGGAVPGDAHAFRLYENPGQVNDWINLKLVGVKSNRAAIGARIKVTVENEGAGNRSIYRTVGSGGSFGASPLEQHIGLGKSARITEIEIWWPASNTRQTFTNVGKDQFLEIKEFAKEYTKLQRKSFRLGGAPRDAVALGASNKQTPAKP
jgi:hypothetical protein